jgi:uncharacterized protein YutE (UPF0331/DUF86 family)
VGRPKREGGGSRRRGSGGEPPRSKNQRRLNTVLSDIPKRREQLLVAMEEFLPNFSLDAFVESGTSENARERNKVAVVEHEFEILVNALHELAGRALAEAQRLGVIDKAEGHAWERLAGLGVISPATAETLRQLQELRNDLAHVYPPQELQMLHQSVESLLARLDPYLDQFETWGAENRILR